jgi:hypothetical protein
VDAEIQQVVIEIQDGAPTLVQCPDDVEVKIVDLDFEDGVVETALELERDA